MTLKDLEGYQIRLIGPKVELRAPYKSTERVGRTDEHLGAVVNGEISISADPGLYDLSFRKDLKSPWLSHPEIHEHRVA